MTIPSPRLRAHPRRRADPGRDSRIIGLQAAGRRVRQEHRTAGCRGPVAGDHRDAERSAGIPPTDARGARPRSLTEIIGWKRIHVQWRGATRRIDRRRTHRSPECRLRHSLPPGTREPRFPEVPGTCFLPGGGHRSCSMPERRRPGCVLHCPGPPSVFPPSHRGRRASIPGRPRQGAPRRSGLPCESWARARPAVVSRERSS